MVNDEIQYNTVVDGVPYLSPPLFSRLLIIASLLMVCACKKMAT